MLIVYTLLVFLIIVFLAHLPVIPLLRLIFLPVPNKSQIVKCFMKAWVRTLLVMPIDLLSPVVTPIALLFTRWEAEHLPKFFRWWDNDASINGDVRTDDLTDELGGWTLKPVPLEDTPEARAMCYWAKGYHPRSFYARWVWLGLRNRASSLSQSLGVQVNGDTEEWHGNTWKIIKVQEAYRYIEEIKFAGLILRMHYGFKVPRIPGEIKSPVVAVGFSLKKEK